VWSEQWKFGLPFGAWRLLAADLDWTANGTPRLQNIVQWKTQGLVEAYGWAADGETILFAADAAAGTSWDNLQIMCRRDFAGDPVRISPDDQPTTASWQNYNEFCFPIPDSDRLIFGRSVGAFYFSLEYWTMHPDGTDPQQLTALSLPWGPFYHGFPSLAGGLAFDPDNSRRLVAAFGTNYDGGYKAEFLHLAQ